MQRVLPVGAPEDGTVQQAAVLEAVGQAGSGVLGVEKETGFTLGYDKYNWEEHPDHFLLADCTGRTMWQPQERALPQQLSTATVLTQ